MAAADLTLLSQVANLAPHALLLVFIFLGWRGAIRWEHEVQREREQHREVIDILKSQLEAAHSETAKWEKIGLDALRALNTKAQEVSRALHDEEKGRRG